VASPPPLWLHVRGFRSIGDQEVELRPLTLVYDPNGSGKSSLLYALLVLKNLSLIRSRFVLKTVRVELGLDRNHSHEHGD